MAMYVSPWKDPESLDHVIFAGSLRTPGKCKMSGWNRENVYDIKEGKGTAGASETLKNQPPAKGSFEFTVWDEEQMFAWNPILARLAFKPSTAGTGTAATPASAPGSQFTQGATKNENPNGSSGSTIPEPGNTTGKAKDDSADTTTTKSKDPPALSADSAIPIYYPLLADLGVHHVLPPEKLGQWNMQDDFSFTRTIEFVEFSQPSASSIAATPTGSPDDAASASGAGTSEPGAAKNGAASAAGAGKDAQGSWGAP